MLLLLSSEDAVSRAKPILTVFKTAVLLLSPSKMPPKKAAGGPSKKTEAKKKEKIIEVGRIMWLILELCGQI